MATKTDYALKTLNVVSWIIFIGVCVEAGAFIVYALLTVLLKPEDADKIWKEVDLSELHDFSQSQFISVTSIMIIVAVMRAMMFYLIVKIFYDKKIKLSQPFNEAVRQFIARVAYLALGIGLFSFWGTKCVKNLVTQGVEMPDIESLRLAGADVWLFMGIILLVIARVFKRGIELQNENDLTV